MGPKIKAISIIIVGTIGVGFLTIPFAFNAFGLVPAIILLAVVFILTLVTNLSFSDIITKEKQNHQIPGYVEQYFGRIPAYIISFVTIGGLLGVLLAYATLAGEVLSQFSLLANLPQIVLSLIFSAIGLFIMNYGVKLISKFSTLSIVILISALIFLMILFVPNIEVSNTTSLNIENLHLVFGVFIFAFFSLSSVPVIDELIGYDKKLYKRIVTISMFAVFLIYLVFGLVFSLALGTNISSHFVDSIVTVNPNLSVLLSTIVLLSISTSFVLVSNNVKEVLSYDYKINKNIVLLLIGLVLGILIILNFASFEQLISTVGNFSLAVQSLAVLVVWFKSKQRGSLGYKVLVAISGIILIGGILVQV